MERSGLSILPIGFSVSFQLRKPRVIIRKLLEVRESDLPRQQSVVVRDVCFGVACTVFQFDLKTHPELLKVDTLYGKGPDVLNLLKDGLDTALAGL